MKKFKFTFVEDNVLERAVRSQTVEYVILSVLAFVVGFMLPFALR